MPALTCYALADVPAPCQTCGGARTVEVDMTPDAEPFAWCEPCGFATFKAEETTP